MTYEEQLSTPEWAKKRQEIIDRDWGMCTICMRTKNLQVHHKRYINGRMAWEYDGWDSFLLVTLCDRCHTEVHGFDWVKKQSPMPDDFGKRGSQMIDDSTPKHIGNVINDWIIEMDKRHG